MDPTYQALMAQQLMGGGTAAPGMGGQNPTTGYGASFMTGNQQMPQGMGMLGPIPGQQGQMAGNPNVLQQPMTQYPGA